MAVIWKGSGRGENLLEFSGDLDPCESPDGVLPSALATGEVLVHSESCEGSLEVRAGGCQLQSWHFLAAGLEEWYHQGRWPSFPGPLVSFGQRGGQ